MSEEMAAAIRKLEDLRSHRAQPHQNPGRDVVERQRGELNGLDMAIQVLKGEL